MSAIISSVLIIAVPIILIGFLGSLMNSGTTGSIIGFILGGIALSNIAPKRMVVINPEWCGYVTQDIFSKGAMISYGPGVHASHWWEQRNANGNYSLKVKPQSFNVGVATASGKVIFEGQYEYAVDLPVMDRAIGIDQEVVGKGITAFIDNFLTVRFAGMKSEEVRTKEELEKLGADLQTELMDSDGTLAAIHKKYGYKTVAIIIDKVSLPDDIAKTRNAIDEAEALFEVVAKLHGMSTEELKTATKKGGTITQAEYQKMLTRAMAVSDNKTTIEVKVVEGLEGSPAGAVAATLDALSKGGKK